MSYRRCHAAVIPAMKLGAATIGRTLAINSGSEYATGRIHGVIVKLADASVLSHQFTIG